MNLISILTSIIHYKRRMGRESAVQKQPKIILPENLLLFQASTSNKKITMTLSLP
jgi:hypothetical protein